MQLILTVLHLALAIGLVGLILIQHGRGADAGAAFGSGASGTVFGAQGSGSFLTRTTAILATLFFLTSMALAYFAAQVGEPQGLMDGVEPPPVPPVPVVIDSGDVPMPDSPAATFEAADDIPDDLPLPPAPPGEPETGESETSAQGGSEMLDMPTPRIQPQEGIPAAADAEIDAEAAPAAGDSDMPPMPD
jgi:preprotein translocase subunit SecG